MSKLGDGDRCAICAYLQVPGAPALHEPSCPLHDEATCTVCAMQRKSEARWVP